MLDERGVMVFIWIYHWTVDHMVCGSCPFATLIYFGKTFIYIIYLDITGLACVCACKMAPGQITL